MNWLAFRQSWKTSTIGTIAGGAVYVSHIGLRFKTWPQNDLDWTFLIIAFGFIALGYFAKDADL